MPQTLKKMIAESKDFKTITLRGLEDKKNLVEIMNQVMQEEGLKTGQSVIEYIIADYAKKTAQLKEVTERRKNETKLYYEWRDKAQEENDRLTETLLTIKKAFQLIAAI